MVVEVRDQKVVVAPVFNSSKFVVHVLAISIGWEVAYDCQCGKIIGAVSVDGCSIEDQL